MSRNLLGAAQALARLRYGLHDSDEPPVLTHQLAPVLPCLTQLGAHQPVTLLIASLMTAPERTRRVAASASTSAHRDR